MMNENSNETALSLRGKWVFHTTSNTIGFVEDVKESEDLHCFVVHMREGHTFLAKVDNFVPLIPDEVNFFQAAQLVFARAVKEIAATGRDSLISMLTGTLLIAIALRQQAEAFENMRNASIEQFQRVMKDMQ